MYYHVSARLRDERAAELHRRLTDGSLLAQKPDGREIVESLQRARVQPDGRVEWTELCFCRPPLAHERRTVLDAHFEDMRIEPIPEHRAVEGEPFLPWLARRAGQPA